MYAQIIGYPKPLVKIFVRTYNPGMDEPKRPRGRPRLKNPATERVHFRCTPVEKTSYRRKAKRAKKGLSAWLKGLADEA